MADVSYEVVFPDVLVHAPNCPEPTVVNAIRNACIEFCSDTLILTQPLDPISVSANDPLITIDKLPGYEVEQLVGPLFFNGRRLTPKTPQELDNTQWQNWALLTSNEPWGYICFKPDEVTLIPIPLVAAADAITGKVAYTPTRTSTRASAEVLNGYRETIAAGALARLLMIPDQPYTNEKKALGYAKYFSAAKSNAAASVRASFMRAPMRVLFPGF